MDVNSISSIKSISSGKIDQKFEEVGRKSGVGFKETVNNLINEVNDLQHSAGKSIEQYTTGEIENVHEVMIAMSKAEVSFKFMMETRNKLVDAYKEVMHMQV